MNLFKDLDASRHCTTIFIILRSFLLFFMEVKYSVQVSKEYTLNVHMYVFNWPVYPGSTMVDITIEMLYFTWEAESRS